MRRIRNGTRSLILAAVLACASMPSWALALNEAGRLSMSQDHHTVSALLGSTDQNRVWGLLELRMEKGWSSYWKNPGDAGLSLSLHDIQYHNASGFELFWPVPQTFAYQSSLRSYGYQNLFRLPFSFTVIHPSQSFGVQVRGLYSVCSETVCIPQELDVELESAADVQRPEHDRMIADALATLPAQSTFQSVQGVVSTTPEALWLTWRLADEQQLEDVFVHSDQDWALEHPVIEHAQGRVRVRVPFKASTSSTQNNLVGEKLNVREIAYRTNVGNGLLRLHEGSEQASLPPSVVTQSVWLLLLLAFLGGMILHLMPCVLPVLALKLQALKQHPQHVSSGMGWTAVGIVSSFLILFALLIALRALGLAVGIGFHFQQPSFVIFFMLLLLFFAYSQLGMISITLPDHANRRLNDWLNASASGRRGHLTHGALMTLLATPCSAPFLGGMMAYAITQSNWVSMALLGAAALGLSSPYIVLSLFPRLIQRINIRSSRRSLWLQQALGVLSFCLALWMLTVLATQRGLVFSALIFLLANALIVMLLFGQKKRRPLTRSVLLLALLMLFSPLIYRTEPQQGSAWAETGALAWNTFDESRIAERLKLGQQIFIDMTASWCITCKFNEWNVLDHEQVRERLSAADVYLMRGDISSYDPELMRFINRYGRVGIPFNAVIRDSGTVVLSELLSVEKVLQALDR